MVEMASRACDPCHGCATHALPDQMALVVRVYDAESAMHGLALLDVLPGYDRAILIDAIQSGRHRPGTVLDLDPAALGPVAAPALHHVGLPELLALARDL